jgi:uncharacterized membrane protein YfcA
MLEIIGYICAVFIGISLGLIGGGGSILTVPVLVYLMGVSPVIATSYSLFIVGFSSMIGAVRYARKGMVDFRVGLIFGIPSIASVIITKAFIVPNIPEQILTLGSFSLTKDLLLMLLFAVIMIIASYKMIVGKSIDSDQVEKTKPNTKSTLLFAFYGVLVGLLAGLIGAGGGFLIIPTLVFLSKLKMKKAVATSLFIITINSLFGFSTDISNYTINWNFLLIFTAIAASGIFIGSFLSTKIDGKALKKGFGWFVLVMGVFILLKELL